MDRSRIAVALGVLVLAWVFWPGGSDTWPIENRHPARGLIVCFGDSLTAGRGADPGETYPDELGRLLRRNVVNRGADGDTTRRALERLEEDVLSLDPGTVIVTLGGNDILRQVPAVESVATLREIFRRLRAAGAMVVFLSIDPPFVGGERMDAIRDLSREMGVLHVDSVMRGLWGDPKLMSDRIHPNAAGYRVIAERVRDAVEPFL